MVPHTEIVNLQRLTLSELHECLKQRGVELALSKLSEFVRSGDVAEQLRAGGKGNRREFLPDTVEVLAAFLPRFRDQKGVSWEQAPAYLRSFLHSSNGETPLPSQLPVEFPETAKLPVSGSPEITKLIPMAGEAVDLGREIVSALRRSADASERLATGTDAVYDAQGAAAFLCCSVRMLRRNVPASFRLGKGADGDRWYRRDLLRLKGGKR